MTGELRVAGGPAVYKMAKNLYRKKMPVDDIARILTIAVMQSKKEHEEHKELKAREQADGRQAK